MRRILTILLISPLLLSCGRSKGKISFDVQLDGLDQADLLIYSPSGAFADLDTLHLQNGKCKKAIDVMPGTHTYNVIYPNMSLLSFTAAEGARLKMRGSAQQLGEVTVKGADSILVTPATHQPEADRLPEVGQPMPADSVLQACKQPGKALLVLFWANWQGNAGNLRHALSDVADNYDSLATALSYSLDVDYKVYENARMKDSTRWASHCDFLGWDSPAVRTFHLNNIPYYVLIDKKGNIQAYGTDFERDIEPLLKKAKGK